MAPFEVSIRIGGLVMFSQPTTSAQKNGLHVLFLPSAQFPHTPWFSPDWHARHRIDASFAGKTIDLHSVLDGGATPANLPNLVRASKLTGKKIPPVYFNGLGTSTDPLEPLLARLILPFPQGAPKALEIVRIRSNNGGSKRQIGHVAGTLEFRYTAKNPFTVEGIQISAETVMDFCNSPNSSMSGPVSAGTDMPHAKVHLDWISAKQNSLRIETDEAYTGKSLLAANPVECASSSGCPPEDPDCGWG